MQAAAPDVERSARGRRASLGVLRAMRAQSMEFSELNVEYGYAYDSAAVVPDGSPAPEPIDDIRIYEPSTRPGAPLPHAWIDDEDGNRRPIKDLVAPGRFLLIAGEDGERVVRGGRATRRRGRPPARRSADRPPRRRPLRPALRVASPSCRSQSDGAILVRPDRLHRLASARPRPTTRRAELADALGRILARPVATRSPSVPGWARHDPRRGRSMSTSRSSATAPSDRRWRHCSGRAGHRVARVRTPPRDLPAPASRPSRSRDHAPAAVARRSPTRSPRRCSRCTTTSGSAPTASCCCASTCPDPARSGWEIGLHVLPARARGRARSSRLRPGRRHGRTAAGWPRSSSTRRAGPQLTRPARGRGRARRLIEHRRTPHGPRPVGRRRRRRELVRARGERDHAPRPRLPGAVAGGRRRAARHERARSPPDRVPVVRPRAARRRMCRAALATAAGSSCCCPTRSPADFEDPERVWSLLEPWYRADDGPLTRSTVYEFRSMLADEMRSGHVLLVGDAAHLTPPFLGQGLCSGLRDAANLAWKLDLVLRGAGVRASCSTRSTPSASRRTRPSSGSRSSWARSSASSIRRQPPSATRCCAQARAAAAARARAADRRSAPPARPARIRLPGRSASRASSSAPGARDASTMSSAAAFS